jgi:ubiquinone/menaquinone biosynthesis C-methylase UbiE
MTYVDSLLRSQLGRPSGLFGSLIVGPVLNVANTGLISTTIELAAPQANDTVLDVGFGGGASLAALAGKAPHARIVGIDYSRDMVADAGRRIAQQSLRSHVRVLCGDVAALPFADGVFDRIITINSLYYWPRLMAGLREMARVLKPHGRLAIGYHSPDGLRVFTQGWEGFANYEPEELARRLRHARFEMLAIEHRDRWSMFDTVVLLAERGRMIR